jgi:hypothetical protein
MTSRRLPHGPGASLLLAVLLVASAPAAIHLAAQQATADNAVPTPRMPDGTPDFNGIWSGGGGGAGFGAENPDDDDNVVALLRARAPELDRNAPVGTDANYAHAIVNFERDSGMMQRMDPNRPLYKPEFWEKVQQLDLDGNALDPAFKCLPEGVPRMGPPEKIVHTPKEMIFLYGLRMTRVIPIDGRPLPPVSEWVGLWNGVSRGRWEGDELVIETVDFNDETWLAWPGWFHSIEMKVTERMRREGNTLRWIATVEDTEVLQKPWTTNPRIVRLNTSPNAELEEDLPCFERDLPHMVTKERG